jgi:hypothetical protein
MPQLAQIKADAETGLRLVSEDYNNGLISQRGYGAAVVEYDAARATMSSWIVSLQTSVADGSAPDAGLESKAQSWAATFINHADSSHDFVNRSGPYCPENVVFQSRIDTARPYDQEYVLVAATRSGSITYEDVGLPSCLDILSLVTDTVTKAVQAAIEVHQQEDDLRRQRLSALLQEQEWSPSTQL